MASLRELEIGLENADKAGDTEAAQDFAAEIMRMRSAEDVSLTRSSPANVKPRGLEPVKTLGKAARFVTEGAYALPELAVNAGIAALNLIPKGLKAAGVPERYAGELPYYSTSAALSELGLPQAENASERVIGSVIRGMSGAGATILAAKATQPISEVGLGLKELFSTRPDLQLLAGGSSGAASQLTAEAGGGPFMQTAAGFAGGMFPSLVASVATGPMKREYKELVDLSKQQDVPLSYYDIKGGGKKVESALEQLPFIGTSRFRAAGAKKVDMAARRIVNAQEQAVQDIPFDNIDQVKQIAASGGTYAKTAQNVLTQIENSGDDWSKIIQASGNLQALKVRQTAENLYNKVGELSKQAVADADTTYGMAASQYKGAPVAKPGHVALDKTFTALNTAIRQERKAVLPDENLVKTLERIQTKLANNPNIDFSGARDFRSEIGSLIDNYLPGNQVIGDKGTTPLMAVKTALENDMGVWAKNQGGEIYQAWKTADAFYKNRVIPFKDPQLARALRSDLPDEVYRQFIQTGRAGGGTDRALKFYNALDPKGQAAVRYGMVANALDEAFIASGEVGAQISPAKFAQSLEKIQEARGVFFRGDQQKQMDGLVNLMRHAERFGQYAADPMNGRQVVPWLIAGGGTALAKVSPGSVAAATAGSFGLSQLLTTQWTRDLLLRAASAQPGSKQMIAIQSALASYVNAVENGTIKLQEQAPSPVLDADTIREATPVLQ